MAGPNSTCFSNASCIAGERLLHTSVSQQPLYPALVPQHSAAWCSLPCCVPPRLLLPVSPRAASRRAKQGISECAEEPNVSRGQGGRRHPHYGAAAHVPLEPDGRGGGPPTPL